MTFNQVLQAAGGVGFLAVACLLCIGALDQIDNGRRKHAAVTFVFAVAYFALGGWLWRTF